MNKLMEGKKGLIMGVANNKSIAWSIAQQLYNQGAEIALSYQGEVLEKRLLQLAPQIGDAKILPCDVSDISQINSLMSELDKKWGKLDFIVHAIGFSDRNELQGKFIDTSPENFQLTMNISVFSFVAVVKAAQKLLQAGENASVLTMTYYGSQVVMPNYNVMGVAKAALEAATRYLAVDLGSENIRVNAISAGAIRTLAASGIKDIRLLLEWSEKQTALRRSVSLEDVGKTALYLLSNLSSGVTGEIHYVDCGFRVNGMIPIDAIPGAAEVLTKYSKTITARID